MSETAPLASFLSMPLWTSTPVFEAFKTLPKHIYREDPDRDFHRFLYVPGTREDRVVLVAHADTVWDERYGYAPTDHFVHEENGYFVARDRDGNRTLLGADDRAGCAILWLLRDSGHSLLITDGEERGQKGSHYLMNEHPDVADEINRHQYMVQFDRRNSHDFKCYRVGTDAFRAFIAQETGYSEPDTIARTDIGTLCRDICGVNLSIGYYSEHTPNERLCIAEWEHTLHLAKSMLSGEIPKFALTR